MASLQVGKSSTRVEVNATEAPYKSKSADIISEFANTYACGYFSPTQLHHDKLFPFVGAPDYSMISLWMLSGYKESAEKTKLKYISHLVTLRINIHQCFLKPQSLRKFVFNFILVSILSLQLGCFCNKILGLNVSV